MTPVEKYLEHLDKIFQREPEFFKNESVIEGVNNVTAILYKDFPTIGYVTAVTYGLSLVEHDDWKNERAELFICVQSDNIDWGIVIGYIANHLRGKFPFTYGNTINFGEKINEESEMDAFLIFTPTILDRKEFMNVEIGLDYKINLSALYPIYKSEIEVYNQIGIEAFLNHPKFDFYNVKREVITTN